MKKELVWVALAAVSAGCAIGRKIEYRGVGSVTLPYDKTDSNAFVRINVVDARSEARAAWDDGSYVGRIHAFFPIPWPVRTNSERPLATDIGETIVAAFSRRGLQATLMDPRLQEDELAARRRAIPSEGGLGILVTIRRWHTAAWFSSELVYDLTAKLFAADGRELASETRQGAEPLSVRYASNEADNQDMSLGPTLSGAFSTIFTGMLNTLAFRNAFRAFTPEAQAVTPQAAPVPPSAAPLSPLAPATAPMPAAASAPTPSRAPPPAPAEKPGATKAPLKAAAPPSEKRACSVEQILKMKEMKLTDEQIRSACE